MSRQSPNIQQISDSLKVVSDLASRTDERVKIIFEGQESTKDLISSLQDKMKALEIKLENTNYRLGNHDARWSNIFDLVWKIALMVIAGYILYALGLQADLAFPPT
jgi:methyl-accepting chemotaxis protein